MTQNKSPYSGRLRSCSGLALLPARARRSVWTIRANASFVNFVMHFSNLLQSQTGRIVTQNPNIEIRNPKQYQMTKTSHKPDCLKKMARIACFEHYGIRICFEFRNSDFGFKVFTNMLDTAEPF